MGRPRYGRRAGMMRARSPHLSLGLLRRTRRRLADESGHVARPRARVHGDLHHLDGRDRQRAHPQPVCGAARPAHGQRAERRRGRDELRREVGAGERSAEHRGDGNRPAGAERRHEPCAGRAHRRGLEHQVLLHGRPDLGRDEHRLVGAEVRQHDVSHLSQSIPADPTILCWVVDGHAKIGQSSREVQVVLSAANNQTSTDTPTTTTTSYTPVPSTGVSTTVAVTPTVSTSSDLTSWSGGFADTPNGGCVTLDAGASFTESFYTTGDLCIVGGATIKQLERLGREALRRRPLLVGEQQRLRRRRCHELRRRSCPTSTSGSSCYAGHLSEHVDSGNLPEPAVEPPRDERHERRALER